MNFETEDDIKVNERIQHLRKLAEQNTEEFKRYTDVSDQCMLHDSESTKRMRKTLGNEEELAALMEEECKCCWELCFMPGKIIQQLQSIQNVVNALTEVQNVVIHNRLNNWLRHQALAGNGPSSSLKTLDEIQIWFEDLVEVIWETRMLIDDIRIKHLPTDDRLTNFTEGFDAAYSNLDNLLHNLVISSFIVEEQPCQVMEINSRFRASVRLLLTNISYLSVDSVTASILSETQAQAQQQNSTNALDITSGGILNHTGQFELLMATQEHPKRLTCELRDMKLENIIRPIHSSNKTITNEKYSILFQTRFQTGHMQFNVWVRSLPMVVIEDRSQESRAWATITWDNAFFEASRTPFTVVDRVPWLRMAFALNIKFEAETGRGLSVDSLYYLYEKACHATIDSNPQEYQITFSQFCEDPLPGHTFTFWDWFYAAMELTRDHLHELSAKNLIIGFISRHRTEQMLLKCKPGTFLLRFSNSILGGISVAWVKETVDRSIRCEICQPMVRRKHVVMIQPCCTNDLSTRSLISRIQSLHEFHAFYPDILKSDVLN